MGNEIDPSRDPRLNKDPRDHAKANDIDQGSRSVQDPDSKQQRISVPRRRKLGFRDKSHILEQDASETVEYIRGVGMVKTKIDLPSGEDEVGEWADSSAHNVLEVLQESDSPQDAMIYWMPDRDALVLESKRQRTEVKGSTLRQVTYCYSPPIFVIDVHPVQQKPFSFIFQIKDAYCFRFRSVITSRLRTDKIKRIPDDKMPTKIAEIKAACQYNGGNSVLARFSTCEVRQSRQDDAESTDESQSHNKEILKDKGVFDFTMAEPRFIKLPTGETVKVGDLVFRIRDPADPRSNFQFDENDIFDGPFRILDSSTSMGLSHSRRKSRRNRHKRSRESSRPTNEMDSLFVKLELPEDPTLESPKASPWTPVRCIRKAYIIPPCISQDEPAERLFDKAVAADALSVSTNFRSDDDIWTVTKLDNGKVVKVLLVDPVGLGDDVFVVEKLRGKRKQRINVAELPMGFDASSSSNPTNIPPSAEQGDLPDDQALVVQYLVHWAGWPSEDDSWEVAWNNIPQELVQNFEEGHLE